MPCASSTSPGSLKKLAPGGYEEPWDKGTVRRAFELPLLPVFPVDLSGDPRTTKKEKTDTKHSPNRH